MKTRQLLVLQYVEFGKRRLDTLHFARGSHPLDHFASVIAEVTPGLREQGNFNDFRHGSSVGRAARSLLCGRPPYDHN